MIIQGFVFEMQSVMNEFDHCIFALLKLQRESEKKKCNDQIHSFHSAFQIQILVLSSR